MRIYVTKYNIDLPRATLQIDLKALRGIWKLFSQDNIYIFRSTVFYVNSVDRDLNRKGEKQ